MDGIEELQNQIDRLKDSNLDLLTHINYCKQTELIELLRELLTSINTELKNNESELTKEDVLNNLKKYIKQFAKDNRLNI
jgi:gas vesicle protein